MWTVASFIAALVVTWILIGGLVGTNVPDDDDDDNPHISWN